jgi:hypothetical protein
MEKQQLKAILLAGILTPRWQSRDFLKAFSFRGLSLRILPEKADYFNGYASMGGNPQTPTDLKQYADT